MPIVLMLLLAMAVPATPKVPTPPDAPKPKKICQADIDTGSRLRPKPRCMTAEQWKAEAEEHARQQSRDKSYSPRN